MEIDGTKMVKEIVFAIPASARVFEQLGIDYCCGGDKRLDEACKAAGVQLTNLARSLEAAAHDAGAGEESTDWSEKSLAELMNHIIEKHHNYCRQEVALIEPLLDKVAQVHGDIHSELRRIKSLFAGLSKELLMHLVKEEQTLFPYIVRMEEAVTRRVPFPRPLFGTVQNPVQMMVLEHDSAGAALHEIHELSHGYEMPPDGCGSYRTLYEALRAFESDMHQHVHLENNVLFPRAVAMEEATLSGQESVSN
ncbi:MAG TPA: iron-sulfur cluster repair di-iron protein [Terriglobia bacterium]|nr:iron-sulfur cluster repair di-iron protein [Terriglobia bacterium]